MQISDITQLQAIKDEKLSGGKVVLGMCGIGVGVCVGFVGLIALISTAPDRFFVAGTAIMVGSWFIKNSFSKDKQTYDFNKIPAEKKKEILIRLIERGELLS